MTKTALKITGFVTAVVVCAALIWPVVRDHQRRQTERQLAGRTFMARDYYPLAPGTAWTYDIRDGADVEQVTVRVAGALDFEDRPAFQVMFGDQAYKLLGYDESGLVKYKEFDDGEEEIYAPVGMILPDLTYGQARTFHPAYSMRSPHTPEPVRANAEMSFWVEAVETVRVPAGTFPESMRIGYYDRWEEQDGSYDISRGRIWFAKGVGIVKITGKEIQFDRMRGAEETNKETHVLRAFRPGPARGGVNGSNTADE